MDDRRFDHLARALAAGTNRRRLLAGSAGAALALLGVGGAAAERKKPKKPKKREGYSGGEPCNQAVCGEGFFCCNFSCSTCAPLDGFCTQQICE